MKNLVLLLFVVFFAATSFAMEELSITGDVTEYTSGDLGLSWILVHKPRVVDEDGNLEYYFHNGSATRSKLCEFFDYPVFKDTVHDQSFRSSILQFYWSDEWQITSNISAIYELACFPE